jgi:CubicO group peptidase (beta-lactamase class C family)
MHRNRLAIMLAGGALLTQAPAAPLFATAAQSTGAVAASPLASAFDGAAARQDVEAVMTRERIPGAQIVVLGNDGVIWRTALGLADRERNVAMTPGTLLQIGSVTKVFTAALLADLVAQGKLAWTDTLSRALPGIAMRPEVGRISLAELASHGSKLPKDPPNRVDVDGVWRAYSRAELHAALNDPALKLVGEDWHYSNFGFAILGRVIEQATGQPYETVLRQRLFAPLGMDATRIALSTAQVGRLATHYWPEDDPLKPRPRWVFGEVAGFGGITSTADDLAKLLAYQMNPRGRSDVLDADAMVGMRTVRIVFPDWRVGFGRPWIERREADGTLIIEHGGEVDGHSAIIAFAPAQGVGVAVTANLGQTAAERVARPLLARAIAAARGQPKTREQAMRFYQSRQWADAEAAFARLTAQQPDDGDGWFRLGRARFELHDMTGARAALDRAVALPKPSPNAHYYLAAIAANQGRLDDALAIAKRGLAAGLQSSDLAGPELRLLHADPRWRAIR